MASCQRVLVLLLGWSYLYLGYCARLKEHFTGLSKDLELGLVLDAQDNDQNAKKAEDDLSLQDTVSEHMRMLYAKYNQAGFPFKDGNTVRSFRAHLGMYTLLKAFR